MRGDAPLMIAIDGPAASGKSTVAEALSRRLGIALVDSGSMYRAVTLLALELDVPLDDPERLGMLARRVSDEFRFSTSPGAAPRVFLGEREVTLEIRSPDVGDAVSPVSAAAPVRDEMVRLQRSMVAENGAVVEGRDIGTTVFPDAPLKVYLEASARERARRRYRELKEKGVAVTKAQISGEIARRDSIDSSRENSPLSMAPDALRLDTTGMGVDQVVDRVVEAALERGLLRAPFPAPPQ